MDMNPEFDQKLPNETEADDFEILDEELLPPVNEFKRFWRVFFRRKIVLVSFIIVILAVLVAIFADFVAPFGPLEMDLTNVLAPPGGAHLLGTDAVGRDLLSRIIHGSRIAFTAGISTVLVSAAFGTLVGLIAGYSKGIVQTVIMRFTDAIMSFPPIILALLIASVLRMGVPGVVLAIAITMFPGYIRLICGQVLSIKQNDYVSAAKVAGAKTTHILFRHVLPNCLSPLIVQMTMMMGVAIMAEAGLSFLGIGITPPTPAWGSLTFDGYRFLMNRPLLSIAPGLSIMILVFSFNMVGDGLRDALDPKLRGSMD